MTHRIVVDLATGTITQVEYTAEEQASYDAAVQEAEVPAKTPAEPTVELTQEV